jgi:hypothetical protein
MTDRAERRIMAVHIGELPSVLNRDMFEVEFRGDFSKEVSRRLSISIQSFSIVDNRYLEAHYNLDFVVLADSSYQDHLKLLKNVTGFTLTTFTLAGEPIEASKIVVDAVEFLQSTITFDATVGALIHKATYRKATAKTRIPYQAKE